MKIEQEPKFQPIVITLETAEEAEAFWAALRGDLPKTIGEQIIRAELSNWFSNHAQLGGK